MEIPTWIFNVSYYPYLLYEGFPTEIKQVERKLPFLRNKKISYLQAVHRIIMVILLRACNRTEALINILWTKKKNSWTCLVFTEILYLSHNILHLLSYNIISGKDEKENII